MDTKDLIDGLIAYLCFIPVLTCHEWAHAWVAMKCGDDTAKNLGRVSLNPAVHIDPVGTIALPLLAVFLGAMNSGLASFIIGWGKPVPVNPSNLRHRRVDDTLIALAGPFMNIVLALIVIALARVAVGFDWAAGVEIAQRIALVSLFLCFFNLLPVPPLDGSHVVKNAIGMREETYWNLCRFGFIAVIIVIQIPFVRSAIASVTATTFVTMLGLFGLR
jgi:Zn-dependent protease